MRVFAITCCVYLLIIISQYSQEVMSLREQLEGEKESVVKRDQQKQLIQQTLQLQGANENHRSKIVTLENK